MSLATSAKAKIAAAVTKHGSTVNYTVVAAGVYDRSTQTNLPSETDKGSIKAFVEDMKGEKFQGETIKGGDKKLILAAGLLTFVPTIGDKFTYDSQTYTVLAKLTNSLTNIALSFELMGRR